MTLATSQRVQDHEDDNDRSSTADPSESLHNIPINPDTRSFTNTITEKMASATPEEVEALAPEEIPELESPELEIGDHVYQWRSLCGVPHMFQHHGIVMDVIKDEEGKPIRLTIADFSNVETTGMKSSKKNASNSSTIITENMIENSEQPIQNASEAEEDIIQQPPQEDDTQQCDDAKIARSQLFSSRRVSLEQDGVMRTYTDTDKWHKVHYQSGWWKRQFRRSGTVTKARSDPVGLVLARVNFIMQNPDQLPDYHVVHANCECVAFWCKTGEWSTLQASSFLELTAAGQVKSSATLAATAAGTTSTISVPASGIWGSWFGMTTTTNVSWMSLHPMAIPGLACYAAITVGVPAVMYATAHKKWKQTSERLSNAFWDSATANPDVFAECITHWSEK